MLRKPIVRNLDLYYVYCYISYVYVSVITLCVMELLQIKVCIFGYSREATILHVCNSILQVETFQKQILSFQKNLLFIRRIIFAITDIYGYTNDDDTCKKTNVNIYKDCPMFSEQMLTSKFAESLRFYARESI